MEKINKSICIYVAYLRALYFLHQQHHWVCSGKEFYALHQLFERIYESAQENADAAAEKFVGLFDDECLDIKFQTEYFHKILTNLPDVDLIEKSLTLEIKFLEYSKDFYSIMKDEHADKITMGLDDLLMEIASRREEACYLLKRTLKGRS